MMKDETLVVITGFFGTPEERNTVRSPLARPRSAGFTIGLLFLAGLSTAVAGRVGQSQAPEDIYLLMGQSNMSGRGFVADLPAEMLEPDARIELYGNDGAWRVATEPLDSATNQIDAVSADKEAGVGPGLAFARSLLRLNGRRPIGLVSCAKGGTSIREWAPSLERTTLYGSCLARAREASSRGRIAGILWYQGETDASDEASAQAWAPLFIKMITQFRAALNNPKLPLVVVGLGDQPKAGKYAGRFPIWAPIQRAQRSLQLHHQYYVSAAGLPRNPDELHLSTTGQIELGHKLASALQGKKP